MNDIKYTPPYLEWCEIMKLEPNERDFTIFHTGYNFALIDMDGKLKVGKRGLVLSCKGITSKIYKITIKK